MKIEKTRVLYVDDEKHNLVSFKANFRHFFEVIVTDSPILGLEILAERKIHVVIADHVMPEKSGIEFLETISRQFPDVIRILITGFKDLEVAINAINKCHIYKYVTKPWNAEELKKTIDQAYETHCLSKRKSDETTTFVSKVSLDFKGPLASIESLVNSAKEELDSESARQYINLIGSRVGHLEKILDELTQYINKEQDISNSSAISFKTLVDEVLRNLETVSNCSEFEFQLNIFQKTDFKSDKGVLKNIIQNLVLNAITFKNPDASKPFISIDIISSDNEAVIEIEDNGIGMPEKVLKNIFRLSPNSNRSKNRKGQGLYLVIP